MKDNKMIAITALTNELLQAIAAREGMEAQLKNVADELEKLRQERAEVEKALAAEKEEHKRSESALAYWFNAYKKLEGKNAGEVTLLEEDDHEEAR